MEEYGWAHDREQKILLLVAIFAKPMIFNYLSLHGCQRDASREYWTSDAVASRGEPKSATVRTTPSMKEGDTGAVVDDSLSCASFLVVEGYGIPTSSTMRVYGLCTQATCFPSANLLHNN